MQPRLIDAIKHGFAHQWALVIGDLMLDRYLWGKVERISPEAPVPVVLLDRETEAAGGAANVSANLVGLGMRTRLVGCIGADDNGTRLKRAIHDLGIDTSGLLQRELTLDQAGDKLLSCMLRTANGRLTAAEALGQRQFVLTRLYESA